jgi:hypothetical protein
MPVSRFKCSRCGVEATRIGGDQRFVPSVQADDWAQLCVMAAAATQSGETPTPMNVNCPYLRGAVGAEGEIGADLPGENGR